MKTTEKTRMYDRITAHGENLKRIFELSPDTDAVKLCKRLHRLETEANRTMVQYCNGEIDEEELEQQKDAIYTRFNYILFHIGSVEGKDRMVALNGDPRGYTLKFTDEATKQAQDAGINIHRDWGGYGIVAPEFDGKK